MERVELCTNAAFYLVVFACFYSRGVPGGLQANRACRTISFYQHEKREAQTYGLSFSFLVRVTGVEPARMNTRS